MVDEEKLNSLDKSNAFFSDYFENMNLNEDLKEIYKIINDDALQTEFEREMNLTKLRNENHKRYYDIDIDKLKGLPSDFDEIVNDILNLYNSLDSKQILIDDFASSQDNEKILNNIYRKMSRLDQMVKTTLKELYTYNDEKKSKFSIKYFESLDINESLKKDLIEKYNELVLYNSVITDNIYDDLKRQVKRKEFINNILRDLNIYEEDKVNLIKKDKLDLLNKKIDEKIIEHQNTIHYLEDLMPEGSKYTEEFKDFKDFCNKIIAYDDKNYENAKQTYEILCDDTRFKILINNFEEMFINERQSRKAEEEFIYNKFGIKNIKISLDYIASNYMNILDTESKNIIDYIYDKINSNVYDLDDISKALGLIVRNIWKSTITDVYEYDSNEDYYFLCSNNQFIDEKYQAILISKRELERVDDYSDYKIGFICGYNDNILYITENDDIMSVGYDDMSNLKTPLQLEQEFINFRVCNRIALDGYKTKIQAVYCINDGNFDSYIKALELANQYNLPLIEFKKNTNNK